MHGCYLNQKCFCICNLLQSVAFIIDLIIFPYNKLKQLGGNIINRKFSNPEKWILLGIPMLFFIGALFHFLYDLSGHIQIIGAISAVNESVWEHCKMVVFPMIAWWCLYMFSDKADGINAAKWFAGASAALITATIAIPICYYFYTQAFGIELLAVDIFILFFALFLGQCIGLHFYKYSKCISAATSITIIVFVALLFIIFTFYPPHLPIFMDTKNGTYGIFKTMS